MSTNAKIKLYSPYEKQRDVHKACIGPHTFFVSVVAGRQAGKSLLSINQALMWALAKGNMTIFWVSPTYSQATKIYKQTLEAVVKMPIVKTHKYTEITFKNGSTIKFRSAAQEDSLRGETVDYLILDEAAFIKEDTFRTILMPMLNVRGKKCLIVTTPKGKNWIHEIFRKGIGNYNPKYKSFKFTSADNPYCNKDIIAMAKESMPKVLFNQEYLAEFVDNSAIFENIEELSTSTLIDGPKYGDSYYAGIDIAMKNDYTVITILNQHGNLVYYDRFTNVTAPELKNRLIVTLNKFKPKKTFIELNNQGGPIYDDLKEMGIKNLHGFNTTSKSKPDIINNLINAFASKKIIILDDLIIKSELESFTMTFNSTGRPKFEAASGFHDDIVMSLAIGWECFQKTRFSGTYSFL